MIVAGVVIETRHGKAAEVAKRLDGAHGLDIAGSDADNRLAAVWTAADGETLEQLAKELVTSDDDVLGVFPTFVGDDEETSP